MKITFSVRGHFFIKAFLCIILTLFTSSVIAQFDTDYWMPPVWESRNGGDTDSMQLVITTAYAEAHVAVKQSDGTIIQEGSVSSGNPMEVYLSTVLGMTYVANSAENDKGLLINSDFPVQVVYRNISHNNQCLAPLKGKFGLGKEFYCGTQTRVKEVSYGDDDNQFISVMATENNTSVTITAPPGKLFNNNKHTVTFNLNKHQTYLVRNATGTNLSNNLAGSHIIADKPIAVMSGGQHQKFGGSGGNNADAGIDQIVPITSDIFQVIGTQYIVVRGGTRELAGLSTDYAIIVAVYDNTEVFIDGATTPVATLNAGEYYEYTLPGNHTALGTPHYIETSDKAYVYHISGLREHEMGMSIVPTIYCAGSKYLEFTRFEHNENYINIIAPDAAFATPSALTINGNEFTEYDASPTDVPGGIGWKTITFAYDTSKTTTRSIKVKSAYYFHLGILVGGNPAGAYGYLSGFSTKVDVLDPEALLPTTRYFAGSVAPGSTLDHCLILQSCSESYTITDIFPGNNTGSIERIGNPGQPLDTCLTYVAKTGFVGYDTVTVNVINDQGNPGSVELIFFVGKRPSANNDQFEVQEEGTTTGNVLTNDTNLEDGEIPEVILEPEFGVLNFLPDGSFTYTPNPGFSGTDQFKYKICDNTIESECDEATVTIQVINQQDKPTVDDINLTTTEGFSLSFRLIYFTSKFQDPDDDELQKIRIVSLPENSTLLFKGSPVEMNQEIAVEDISKLILIPDKNFTGTLTFEWNGNDGTDYAEEAGIVTIIVNSQQIPVVASFEKSGDEDNELVFTADDFTNSYQDDEGKPLQKIKINNLPAQGILYLDGVQVIEGQEINVEDLDKLTFVPYENFHGTTTFVWIGSNGSNFSTSAASVEIEVISIDDGPPVLTLTDTIFQITDTTFTFNLVDYFIDPEWFGLTFNINPIVNVAHGSLTINADGTFIYIPDNGYVGPDSFTFEVCDSDSPPDCVENTIMFEVDNSGSPINPTDYPISIYNGFSPDGDGINDTWEIDNIEKYPANVVQIFNRWGNKIFEMQGYNNKDKVWGNKANTGWVIGSQDLPDGTYFYLIDLGNGEKPLSGYVVINR